MRISNRKYAITGASRGLGAALALAMADAGSRLVLLARTEQALRATAETIRARTGQVADTVACDLADPESASSAGRILAEHHADLDGLIHNGAMWLPGSMADVSDHDIVNCIASASIGSLILTRRVLPNLMARKHADIHTVVSTAGLQNRPLMGVSVAFRAAKSAQTGFSQGLSDELAKTNVRVTAVYPGLIEDISPADALRDTFDDAARTVSNREVVDAILFTLNSPPRVRISSLVIETLSG